MLYHCCRVALILLLCRGELSVAETVHAGRTSQADQRVPGRDPTFEVPVPGPKSAVDPLDEVIVQGASMYLWHDGYLRQPFRNPHRHTSGTVCGCLSLSGGLLHIQ